MKIRDIQFIKELKQQILATRYQAAKLANAEMLKLYYNIGMALEKKFEREKWGSKILDRISDQLQQELPGLRGFSTRSMSKMRVFYQAWNFEQENLPSSTAEIKNTQNSILPSLTDKLGKGNLEAFLSVSFTHHYEIITQIKQVEDRLYYINKVATSFWSVRHLITELKNKSHLKEQNQPNNFPQTLSTQLSNKAIQTFKDEYFIDFSKPMGVSIYKTMKKLPKKYKEQLPDPEILKKLLD